MVMHAAIPNWIALNRITVNFCRRPTARPISHRAVTSTVVSFSNVSPERGQPPTRRSLAITVEIAQLQHFETPSGANSEG